MKLLYEYIFYEENFKDLKNRALKAIQFLENLVDNSLIVSHSTFLKMLVLILIFKDRVTPEMFLDFDKHVWYSNAGITVFDYSEGEWHMITWNDQTHI